jgi:hypothetical protein
VVEQLLLEGVILVDELLFGGGCRGDAHVGYPPQRPTHLCVSTYKY